MFPAYQLPLPMSYAYALRGGGWRLPGDHYPRQVVTTGSKTGEDHHKCGKIALH
jgi:hypothetical protein